jgi:hypothetical protein
MNDHLNSPHEPRDIRTHKSMRIGNDADKAPR